MKKVIVTGFEPFGSYKFNPTQESAIFFNSIDVISGIKVIGLVLPCTYFGAFQTLCKIINQEKPDAIISTGLASSVKRIRIETTFHNVMNGKYPDADGMMPSSLPIWNKPHAKDFLIATANNIYLADILQQNEIPVELSIDADAFICNSLGYLTSKKILKDYSWSSIKNMFIHIPWTDDYKDRIDLEPTKIFLEKEKYYRAIELLIKNI
jgi:pyroglutamyl-peptidase